jgi:hypothetical protein
MLIPIAEGRRRYEVRGRFALLCAEALFASTLQASERPTPDQVRAALVAALRRLGVRGCAAHLAAEFGDHPDTAATRMSWALATVHAAYPTLATTPAAGRRPLTLAS